MRVLITGGCGFAGRHVVRHLLDTTDWELITLDRWADLDGPVTHVRHNLIRPIPRDVSDAIGNVDAVLHLAADSDVQTFFNEPVAHFRNNVDATLNLLEWARRRPRLTHFVQVSTNEVYGPSQPGTAHPEWAPIAPSTPYSASKAAQEALAVAWWRTYGVPTVIVNTMQLYGEGQPAERFVPVAIRHLLDDSPVPLYGDQTRCWTYARDFADALRWILNRPIAVPGRGPGRPDRWNVVGPELSCQALVREITAHIACEARFKWDPQAAKRSGYEPRYALNGTKLERAGWRPPFGLERGLAATIAGIGAVYET